MPEERRFADELIKQVAADVRKHGEMLARVDERTESTERDVKRINGGIADVWREHNKLEERVSSSEARLAQFAAIGSTLWAGLTLYVSSFWKR